MNRPQTFNELMAEKIAKRQAAAGLEAIRKATPETFGQAIAAGEVEAYFQSGTSALADVVWAALHPGSDPPALTPEDRIAAVSNSVEEFRVGLVERMTAAVASDTTATAPVAKASFRGVL
jgi:tryptophanase